jgi:hypothetical protein
MEQLQDMSSLRNTFRTYYMHQALLIKIWRAGIEGGYVFTCIPGGRATGRAQIQSHRRAYISDSCNNDATDAGCRRPA